MSNDPFKWSTPPRGGAPVNSPCIEHDNVNHPAHYTAGRILDKAKECVCGQREQDYGKPEDSFAMIAALWKPYLKERCVGYTE